MSAKASAVRHYSLLDLFPMLSPVPDLDAGWEDFIDRMEGNVRLRDELRLELSEPLFLSNADRYNKRRTQPDEVSGEQCRVIREAILPHLKMEGSAGVSAYKRRLSDVYLIDHNAHRIYRIEKNSKPSLISTSDPDFVQVWNSTTADFEHQLFIKTEHAGLARLPQRFEVHGKEIFYYKGQWVEGTPIFNKKKSDELSNPMDYLQIQEFERKMGVILPKDPCVFHLYADDGEENESDVRWFGTDEETALMIAAASEFQLTDEQWTAIQDKLAPVKSCYVRPDQKDPENTDTHWKMFDSGTEAIPECLQEKIGGQAALLVNPYDKTALCYRVEYFGGGYAEAAQAYASDEPIDPQYYEDIAAVASPLEQGIKQLEARPVPRSPSAPAGVTSVIDCWADVKKQHPDDLVFIRVGDFYETFCADAKLCSGPDLLTETKRGDYAMAGFPVHAVAEWTKKLCVKFSVVIQEKDGTMRTYQETPQPRVETAPKKQKKARKK